MKKVVVTSTNPVKITATQKAFEQMFPEERFTVEGIAVTSDIPDQPMTDAETLQGAHNRIANSKAQGVQADFYVGIEGGIEEQNNEMHVFAWVVVQTHDQKIGKGKTGVFLLPEKIRALVLDGKELGEADDIVFGRINSKQTNGSVGLLTDNLIDRTDFYTHAAILALIPLKNKKLYF